MKKLLTLMLLVIGCASAPVLAQADPNAHFQMSASIGIGAVNIKDTSGPDPNYNLHIVAAPGIDLMYVPRPSAAHEAIGFGGGMAFVTEGTFLHPAGFLTVGTPSTKFSIGVVWVAPGNMPAFVSYQLYGKPFSGGASK